MSTSWDAPFQQIAGQATADAVDVLEGVDLIAEIKATLGSASPNWLALLESPARQFMIG